MDELSACFRQTGTNRQKGVIVTAYRIWANDCDGFGEILWAPDFATEQEALDWWNSLEEGELWGARIVPVEY